MRGFRTAAYRPADPPKEHVVPEARGPSAGRVRQHRRGRQHTAPVVHRAQDLRPRLERVLHPGRAGRQPAGPDCVPRRRYRRPVRGQL